MAAAPHVDLEWLARRESEQVEWKENVADVADVVKTVVAFANDWSNLGGGYVVCGARESKDQHGFPRMLRPGLSASRFKEVEGRVVSACRTHVDPPIVPRVEELPADDPGRRILVFLVPATPHAHSFRTPKDSGKYYVRIDRSTREARNSLLRELLVQKQVLEPWDLSCHPEARLEDIDLLTFRDTLQRMELWDEDRPLDEWFSPELQLSPLAPPLARREPLTGELRPRNFALLLFGRGIQRLLPGAFLVLSTYPGRDRSGPHSQRLMLDGNLIEQVRAARDRLRLEAAEIIDKTREHPNQVKYPPRALEEALVNAAVHRDYTSNQPTRVTVFADRIEVFSPGELPRTVDAEKLRAGRQMPVWRNQALAWFFNRLQLAQAEGQGIATILRTMREAGCPPPTFEVTAGGLLCTLPSRQAEQIVVDGRRHLADDRPDGEP